MDKIGTSIILITHDLGVIAGMCSRVLVMYGGCIVEEGLSREIFYTRATIPGACALRPPQGGHPRAADPHPWNAARPHQPAARLPL